MSCKVEDQQLQRWVNIFVKLVHGYKLRMYNYLESRHMQTLSINVGGDYSIQT